jgi:NHLM bacteriocin system ABC transporter ATP-binding protein
MDNSLDWLTSGGSPIEAKGNQPLLLAGSASVWIVTQGAANLFCVHLKAGQPVGPRHFLLKAAEGDALFGLDTPTGDGLGFLAVGESSTLLVQCPRAKLHQAFGDPGKTGQVDKMLTDWISGLSAGPGRADPLPGKYRELQPAKDAQFEKDTGLRSTQRLLWVKSGQGKLLFRGHQDWPALPPEQWFPLATDAWLLAEEDCTIGVAETAEALKGDSQWVPVDAFNQFILECLGVALQEAGKDQRRRFVREKQEDQAKLSRAIASFVAILKPKGADDSLSKLEEADPLLACCQLVGKKAGIEVKRPHASQQEDPHRASLADVARVSGFRTRQVVLVDDWYNKDNGPLLGRMANDMRPVALVPSSPRRYYLFDPKDKSRRRVNAELASGLDPQAEMFYRPFPNRAIGALDLLKFGIRGCKKDLWTILATGFLGAVLALLVPLMTGVIIGTIIPEAAKGQLLQISLILLTSALAIGMFYVTKAFALVRLEGKMDLAIQAAVWDRILALPVPFFRQFTAGDLAMRSLGINAIRAILSGATVDSILSTLFSTLNLGLLFYYSWEMALLALALSAVAISYSAVIGVVMVGYSRKVFNLQGKTQGVVLQFITGINALRVSGTEDRAFSVWADLFSRQKELGYKSGILVALLQTLNAAFPVLVTTLIFWWYYTYSMATLGTGNFLAFNAAFAAFIAAMMQMAMSLTATMHVIPLYERAAPIFQTLTETDETKARPGTVSGDIEIDHVNFRYSEDGPLILSDLSLSIKPGQFTALVGGSGSGKSTLLRLLLGFETPESGSIYYDGQDMATLDVRELRRQIGVVLQNGKIMPGEVYKNILGTSNLTVDDAWEAARMVGLEDDIKAMPMGMFTMVPAGGGTFSGGQIQRMMIARALVRRPRLLFFDEATSALDNKAQAVVSKSLENLKVTRLAIAHRLSTIINADAIHVLEMGKIVESGNYEELIKLKGFFYELAKRQIA